MAGALGFPGPWTSISAFALAALAACGGGKRAGQGPDDGPGKVQVEGGRLTYPEGSAIRGFERVSAPPALVDLNEVRATPAFAVRSDRMVFAKPLTVSLAVDRAKVPADVTEDRIHAVLASGGLTERLDVPVRWDRTLGRFEYSLTRTYPLVCAEAAVSVATEPTTFVVIDGARLHPVHPGEEPKVYAVEGHQGDSDKIAKAVVDGLARVRGRYETMKYPRVAPLRVEIADLVEHVAGTASGASLIRVNHRHVKDNVGAVEALLAHEYFHIIQQHLVKQSASALGSPGAEAFLPTTASWVYEATADALEMETVPGAGGAPLKLNFGYRSLHAMDSLPGEAHQYQARAFFQFLRARHGDLGPIVQDYFSQILVHNKPPDPLDFEDPADILGSAPDSLEVWSKTDPTPVRVLNRSLKTRTGKGLRRLYLEFLASLYLRKDFEPIRSKETATFGPPGEIRVPADRLETLPVPVQQGGVWKGNRSASFGGDGLSILRTIEAVRRVVPGEKPGGSLQVEVTCPGRKDPNDVVALVFAVGPDGKAKDPTAGNLNKPAHVSDWSSHSKAYVFVVNLTTAPLADVSVKLDARAGSEVRLDYLPAPTPGESASSGFTVSSPALAGLDPADDLNGLRITLYRAESPNGPFQPIPSSVGNENVREDVVALAPGKPPRVAQDKVVLYDTHVRHRERGQPGPFWYQAGQVVLLRLDGRMKPSGAEDRSNVLGPGTPTVRLVPDSGQTVRVSGNWCVLEPSLLVPETNWDAPGADVEVTVGNWTGHFRTGRWEGTRRFGHITREYPPMGARARARVPWRPQGARARIRVRGSGLEAETTVDLPRHDASVELEGNTARLVEELRRKQEELLHQRANEARKAVEEAEAGVAQAEPEGKIQAQVRLHYARYRVLEIERVEIPSVPARAYRSASAPTWDPSLEVQAVRLEYRIEKARRALQIEGDREMIRLYEQAVATAASEESRATANASLRSLRDQLAEHERPLLPTMLAAAADVAARSGDLSFLRVCYAARLRVIDHRSKDADFGQGAPSDRVQALRDLAEALFVLIGEPAESVGIWRLADRLEQEYAVPGYRETLKARQAQWAPAWFPTDASSVPEADLATLSAAGD